MWHAALRAFSQRWAQTAATRLLQHAPPNSSSSNSNSNSSGRLVAQRPHWPHQQEGQAQVLHLPPPSSP
jgi:hypothetical protein